MKRILNLTLMAMLLLTALSCKKVVSKDGIEGTWELRHLAGGQVPGLDPNFKKGNGNKYKFEGQTYTRYEKGEITESGTFTLEKADVAINASKANARIRFSPSEDEYYINLSGNKLTIFIGIIAADGVETTYKRE
ncbi:lipocalin family protein [Pedobacter africanus]|nr:lipocalin family protein [Pedobacter africanus]